MRDLPTLRSGDHLSSYTIEWQLGSGGMGRVFRARHQVAGQVVAIKVLRDDQLGVERAADRMIREASILASIHHAGVPQFYECGVLADGRPWIAMELVQGRALAETIQRGGLAPETVLEMIDGVAGVLAAAHDRGIAHRDLKPDNVFLTPASSYPVRVIDWGIAYQLACTRYTDVNEAIGTPIYMAPEQARGGVPDGISDVYALGVVAYHALAGRPPFLGGSPVEILVQHLNRPIPPLAPRCAHAPRELVALVERMLVKAVDQRPTAGQVHAATQRLRGVTSDAIPTILDDVAGATVPLRSPRAGHG